MTVYYNEFDKKKCAALKELMADELITKGDIDDRPIQEIKARELEGYTQCHFFAGIGLWDYALRLAEWPAERPVWTGSCPCQPFSSAGKQKGKQDERHLWPVWLNLIRQSRPDTVFGEQVPAAIRHHWWDDVADDLEGEGYATRAEIRPACSVGAPHKRDRLWFVAHSAHGDDRGDTGEFSNENEQQAQKRPQRRFAESCCAGSLGNTHGSGSQGRGVLSKCGDERASWSSGVEWIDCPDGKQRLVKSGIRLLANGYPNRVLQLHCAGDGIVPQVAAEFIRASL